MMALKDNYRSHRFAATNLIALSSTILVMLFGAGVYAYYHMYSHFSSYDDEGYAMITVKMFNDGFALYDEVFSEYGPFYYLYKWLLHTLAQAPVTHDITRMFTMVHWLVAAVCCSLMTHRLTRSPLLAALVLLQATVHLGLLAREPGHPQELVVFLVPMALLVGTSWRQDRGNVLRLSVFGVLVAAAILVKINVGLYLAVAAILTLFMFVQKSRITNAALLILVACTLLGPTVLMFKHGWAIPYRTVVTLSLISLVMVFFSKKRAPEITLGQIILFLSGFALTCLVTGGFMLVRGTSVMGLLNGALLRPLRSVGIYDIPLLLSWGGIVAGLTSTVLASAYILQGRIPGLSSKRFFEYLCWLKLALGVLIFSGGLLSEYHILFNYGLPFLWLLLVPTTLEKSTPLSFPRVLLGMAACLQTLQAYPVGGTQRTLATLLFVPIGALLVHDGCSTLRDRVGGGSGLFRRKVFRQYGMAVLFLATALGYFLRMDIPALANQYAESVSLGLPGAERVRLSRYKVAEYRWLTGTLQANADTFISIPGYSSLNFWTGQDPPNGFNAGHWMTLLNQREEEAVIQSLSTYDRPCVIYNATGIAFWLRGQDMRESLNHVLEEFEVVDRFGAYKFMIHKRNKLDYKQTNPKLP
jgi:signal transduction histidine kinase